MTENSPLKAIHVLDGLVSHDSAIDILAHHTDGGGVSDHVFAGRCHANLNLPREVRKSQLGLMLPSRLATSGTRCL